MRDSVLRVTWGAAGWWVGMWRGFKEMVNSDNKELFCVFELKWSSTQKMCVFITVGSRTEIPWSCFWNQTSQVSSFICHLAKCCTTCEALWIFKIPSVLVLEDTVGPHYKYPFDYYVDPYTPVPWNQVLFFSASVYEWNIQCFRRITYKRQSAIPTESIDVAFLHSNILNVKNQKRLPIRKAVRGPKKAAGGRTGERSREARWMEGGKFHSYHPLSFLPFISSDSLLLSASLSGAALSNLSRGQVRPADDETSDCLRGCREGRGKRKRKGKWNVIHRWYITRLAKPFSHNKKKNDKEHVWQW